MPFSCTRHAGSLPTLSRSIAQIGPTGSKLCTAPTPAMDDEEGGSHTDVRANVQDDIAGTDPNAMPQIRLLAGDLGELKPELEKGRGG